MIDGRTGIGLLLLLFTLHLAPAQGEAQLSFGAAAGVGFPAGDFGESGVDPGPHVRGMLEFAGAHVRNFSLRLDGEFQTLPLPTEGSVRQLGGSVNAVFMGGVEFRPYAVGGVGLYRSETTGDVRPRDGPEGTQLAVNGGGGLRWEVGRWSLLVEVRGVNIFSERRSVRILPVSVGVLF